ncbi:MAG: hypothetical protein PHV43_02660 [Candidatus Colwellbacteria bacterium]|nr:hypothetical protein [Candidatus Colwellbacteria bacterium]
MPRVSTVDIVTAVLARLESGREYPYNKTKLNLGFKRADEQLPQLFPYGITFGVAGGLIDSDAVDYAMGTLGLSNLVEYIFSRQTAIRFTSALRVDAEEHLFGKLDKAGIPREVLDRAAAIVEEALRMPDSEVPMEEVLNLSRSS